MGLPGRSSLARVLLLSLLLSALVLAPRAALAGTAAWRPAAAAPAGAVDNRRTPPPGSATLPVRGPMAAGAGSFVPGRVLVGFEPEAGEQGRRAAAAAVDGRVLAGTGRTRVVRLEQGADVRAAARRLTDRPGVAFAEPDWVRRAEACDPAVCWHLQPRPGANVAEAHDDDHRGAGGTVAVVDTGVREAIPDNPATAGVDERNDLDLGDRVAARWRCRDNGCVAAVATPTSSHGTEVASVIAATDDDDGTTGVAPEATVVSYRVDATGGAIPISYLRNALLHIAADPAIDVVNLSLGGSQWSEAEQQAIAIVLAAGKVVVASAGNTGDRVPQYPAAFPGVISVGATDDGGQVADFSSYGKVDVVAPGDCVAVAVVPGFDQDRGCPGDTRDGVAFNSGTSFSAPIVSGVLALAGSRSPLVARLALEASADADNPGGASDAKQWAHGLADATAFVDAHDPDAPPALVLETSGGDGGQHRLGSGDGQLPHPHTTYVAYAVQADRGGGRQPGHGHLHRRRPRHRPVRGGRRRRHHLPGHPRLRRPGPGPAGGDRHAPPSTGSRPATRCPCSPWPPTTRPPASTWSTWPTTTPGGGSTASTATTWTTSTPSPSAGATGSTCRSPAAPPTRWPPCSSTPAPPTCSASSTRPGRAAAATEVGCPTRGLQLPGRGPRHLPAGRVLHRVDRRLPAHLDGAQRRRPADRGPRPRLQPQRRPASRTAAPGRPGRSPAGPSPRSSPVAPPRPSRRTGGGAHSWDGGGRTPGAYTLRVLYTGGRPGPAARPSRSPWTSGGRGSPTPGPPPTRSSPAPTTATATPPPSP